MKKKHTLFILCYGIILQNKYSTTSDSSGLNNLLPLKTRIFFPALTLRERNNITTQESFCSSSFMRKKSIPPLEETLKKYPTFNPNSEEIDEFGNIKSRPIKIKRHENDDDI